VAGIVAKNVYINLLLPMPVRIKLGQSLPFTCLLKSYGLMEDGGGKKRKAKNKTKICHLVQQI
jgi:hypothetical protein